MHVYVTAATPIFPKSPFKCICQMEDFLRNECMALWLKCFCCRMPLQSYTYTHTCKCKCVILFAGSSHKFSIYFPFQ